MARAADNRVLSTKTQLKKKRKRKKERKSNLCASMYTSIININVIFTLQRIMVEQITSSVFVVVGGLCACVCVRRGMGEGWWWWLVFMQAMKKQRQNKIRVPYEVYLKTPFL